MIHATNNLNLQRNIFARQVARKCCPYYCAFNRERIVLLESKFHFQIEDCSLPTVDSFDVRNVDRIVYTYINQKFTREILACVAGVNGEGKGSENARENVVLEDRDEGPPLFSHVLASFPLPRLRLLRMLGKYETVGGCSFQTV